jgi:hypothetical protein
MARLQSQYGLRILHDAVIHSDRIRPRSEKK